MASQSVELTPARFFPPRFAMEASRRTVVVLPLVPVIRAVGTERQACAIARLPGAEVRKDPSSEAVAHRVPRVSVSSSSTHRRAVLFGPRRAGAAGAGTLLVPVLAAQLPREAQQQMALRRPRPRSRAASQADLVYLRGRIQAIHGRASRARLTAALEQRRVASSLIGPVEVLTQQASAHAAPRRRPATPRSSVVDGDVDDRSGTVDSNRLGAGETPGIEQAHGSGSAQSSLPGRCAHRVRRGSARDPLSMEKLPRNSSGISTMGRS
jgi:hypothetical protein